MHLLILAKVWCQEREVLYSCRPEGGMWLIVVVVTHAPTPTPSPPESLPEAAVPSRWSTHRYLPSVFWRARPAWGCLMPGLPSPGLPERGEMRNIYSPLLGRSQSPRCCCACVYHLNYQYTIINLSCRPQTQQRKARLFRALYFAPQERAMGPPQASPQADWLKIVYPAWL